MKQYFKKKYSMSDEGVLNLIKAIKFHTAFNIAVLLPMMIAFVFLRQFTNEFFGSESSINLLFIHYVIVSVIAFIIMYFIGKADYNATHTKVFDESAKTRISLAEKLRKLPLAYFGKKDIADLSATIMSDATTFEKLFSHAVPQLYSSVISTIIIAIMLFIYDYRLALSLFWVVPISFLLYYLSQSYNEKGMKKHFDNDREIIDAMQERLNLAQEIKSYNREEYFVNVIEEKLAEQKRIKIKLEVSMGSVLNISFVLLKLGLATVAIYGAYLLLEGEVEVFTYLSFLLISGAVFRPIMNILNYLSIFIALNSIVERMKEINEMKAQEGVKYINSNGFDITFENVQFSYENGVPVLNGVSFTAKQGEVTALVGPSGSGKTTAAKLAARFWDIDAGKITLGGVDISTVEPETLLSLFSIVFQDVLLFNSTIMENIRLGNPKASDEDVKRVAKIARCDEFIEKMPEGYNTLIGENGERLSGGERQRLSIARALLKDAPIILLDESTASLDAENESKIQESISELIKDKTVIIIAHRMRTVVDADNIVVLKDGKIVENGRSKELIDRNGLFAGMYRAQFEAAE